MMQEWDGTERRTADVMEKVRQTLEAHTKEEMARYKEIIDKINENDAASIGRHQDTQRRIDHLSQSIEAFMAETSEFHAAVKRAFPKDDEGKPDYDGHRTAHLAWISDSRDAKELKKYIRNVVLGAAAVALTSWVVVAIWAQFLRGPGQ